MEFKPIGFVQTKAVSVPRHWSVSEVEGILDILPEYKAALKDMAVGKSIVVIFLFHKSPEFTSAHLFQTPPHQKEKKGVFSICSPVRPNPIGFSVVEVLAINDGRITVKGIDMFDGTPILDLKPFIRNKEDCPSYKA